MEWSPTKGPMYTITVKYLTRLIVELEETRYPLKKSQQRKQEGRKI